MSRETNEAEELLATALFGAIEVTAITNLLIRKGIISKEEYVSEMREVLQTDEFKDLPGIDKIKFEE